MAYRVYTLLYSTPVMAQRPGLLPLPRTSPTTARHATPVRRIAESSGARSRPVLSHRPIFSRDPWSSIAGVEEVELDGGRGREREFRSEFKDKFDALYSSRYIVLEMNRCMDR